MKRLAWLLLLLSASAFAGRTFNNTSSDHLDLATAPATAFPLTISAWSVPTNATDADALVTLGRSGVNVDRFSLEHNAGHCAINVRDAAGTNNRQSSTTSYTSGIQSNCIGMSTSASSRTVWLNGAGKSNGTSTITQPVGVNVLHVSGDQNNGANFFTGRLSHVAIWNVAFTDTQAAYIGSGGNPRYIPGLVAYYKLIPGASPEPDELGVTGLTVTGTGTNSSDPVVGSYWTGSSVADQSWTQNGAISSVTVDSNFMNVNSTFTTTWKHLGSTSNDTTANGAGTSSYALVVTSAAAIAAGDYIRIGGGSPTQVLWVSGTNVLLATARTWANADAVDEYSVDAASITGVSLSAGSLSGTPSGSLATTANYFFRATNSTTATLIADSNLFSITIASSGGFTVAPTIASVTATTATIGYTTSGSEAVHAVGCKKDLPNPTKAEVLADTCASGATPEAHGTKTSNGADTIVLTGLTFPVYDIYAADSTTRADMQDTCLAAASGKQIINCPGGLISIASGSPVDLLNASIFPPWAVGDILTCDIAMTPGGYAFNVSTNGNMTYTGDASRQYANCLDYDTSAAAFHADDLDLWSNNQAPLCYTGAPLVFFFRSGVPITPRSLTPYATDPEGDTITFSLQNDHGLGVVGGTSLEGTILNDGVFTDPAFTATDTPGDTCSF